MITMALVVHALVYGGVMSALLGVIILASMAYNPELWLNDYPPAIREKYGPASERTKRQRKWVSIPFLLVMAAGLALAGITLERATGIAPGFLALFLTLYLAFLTFNLFDLLVIDLLVGVALQPKFMVLPGTEGMPAYRDVGYHVTAFIKGALGGAVIAAALAGALSLFL